jgi:predicted PolB exonuclease-like 3'-5' exonuclease
MYFTTWPRSCSQTIPDLAAARRLFDLGDASDVEVREALGSGFPKHPIHKIACIGALVASRQPEGWRIDALAPHTGERSEAQLIRDFIEKIGQLQPQLITFNRHSFDLPVLRYRAMVNRIPAAGLQVRQYFHRYTEDALDLCDVLGSYVPGAKVKLDDVSKILGLSGKPVGIDGSRVEEMVLAGQIKEVARYCETGRVEHLSRLASVRTVSRDDYAEPARLEREANPRICCEPQIIQYSFVCCTRDCCRRADSTIGGVINRMPVSSPP